MPLVAPVTIAVCPFRENMSRSEELIVVVCYRRSSADGIETWYKKERVAKQYYIREFGIMWAKL